MSSTQPRTGTQPRTPAPSKADERRARRMLSVPFITYPDLPVSDRRDEIKRAIAEHQVVIVAGATGSGKTTQLPKMCLELGRGINGLIGHTQPRRLAARSVAERIAEECRQPLGQAIGYQVRFTKQADLDTLVKVMTDGILLSEIQGDRLLRAYDTLIIDEAHERSLNIDVILGYLKQILPQRPDLKIIVTSATIDPERFSKHFDGAPIIEVSGRTYPVEVRYRPLVVDKQLGEDDDEFDDIHSVERDESQAIREAVDELSAEGPGDILVFLPGEREIRDTAEMLEGYLKGKHVEVLQLFSRLSASDQQKIFHPRGQGALRRIVLATNVAETSLTVPGIKYVIDSGLARISRYSQRTKVQRLPIEAISQASSNQRSGRCGRTSPGIAIRLFSEDDYLGRPEFTEPEILRTNLASVVLTMASLGLGDVAAFPFIEPPDSRAVADGVRLLEELGALEPSHRSAPRLTETGRQLARLPVDPRIGRMILAAQEIGCLREVLVIAAALSVQDPRERPLENPTAAQQMHKRFADETSDFMAFWNLWQYLRELRHEVSGTQFRKRVRTEYLHYLRIREWQDLHSQLKQFCRDLDFEPARADAPPAASDDIHRALLAGLLSHVGLYDANKREYQGARTVKFAIFPGSGLAKKSPDFVMAAELVETSRLWARGVAKIDPLWAEQVGTHLVKRQYSEPHWSKKRAAVMASEKVTLYGVPLVAGRSVTYARIDPELSRELFIRHALVEGEWETRHHFFRDNRALLREVEELEHRTRQRGLMVDDDTLFEFYDSKIPPHVVSGRHFDTWWKKQRHETPDLLNFTVDLVTSEVAAELDVNQFPQQWRQGDVTLELTYRFEQTAAHHRDDENLTDGLTVNIPVEILSRIDGTEFAWLVPGMREELITALIRGLDKSVRKYFVPAPERARQVLPEVTKQHGFLSLPLTEVLASELPHLPGVNHHALIRPSDFKPAELPPHLKPTFAVIGAGRKVLAKSKDLDSLKRRLATQVKASLEQALHGGAGGAGSGALRDDFTRTGLTTFDLDEIPRERTVQQGAFSVKGYPALVAEPGGVALRVLPTPGEQARAHHAGVLALLAAALPDPTDAALRQLPNPSKLAITASAYATTTELMADLRLAAIEFVADARVPGLAVWQRSAFEGLVAAVAPELAPTVQRGLEWVLAALEGQRAVLAQIKRMNSLSTMQVAAEVREQAQALLADGFVRRAGFAQLQHLGRYLQAAAQRLAKFEDAPHRDRDAANRWQLAKDAYDKRVSLLPGERRGDADVRAIAWMLEEYRVQLFAQHLGTAQTVSDKRIQRAIADLA
ncbi:ATP-dependent RNA helicase HrpA [Micrococcales bacterium 31B]|nr:ATP-dependent RNA helicase HrpA [Micrococcales bacterium 31B]